MKISEKWLLCDSIWLYNYVHVLQCATHVVLHHRVSARQTDINRCPVSTIQILPWKLRIQMMFNLQEFDIYLFPRTLFKG
jgi:hypothetical protein